MLDGYLRPAIEVSFNRISVDGDTSTNDTVLLLASGASGAVVGAENAAFAAALTQVCTSLARQIVADGEGISHVVELHIEGAATDADALKVAKAIAHSPLVKTAWAGGDPELGTAGGGHRLLRRADRSGAHRHSFWRIGICRDGGRAAEFDEAAAHDYIAQRGVLHHHRAASGLRLVRLLDHRPDREYVSINADYSS